MILLMMKSCEAKNFRYVTDIMFFDEILRCTLSEFSYIGRKVLHTSFRHVYLGVSEIRINRFQFFIFKIGLTDIMF